MAFMPATQTTSLATHTTEDIFIRDVSLTKDLIGKLTFTEMTFFLVLGRRPSAAQAACVDACFVTLMEHGLTPSALSTRLIYSSATEAMQGAVAAGLLGVGSLFVGTMEGCAALLERMLKAPGGAEAEAHAIVAEHRAAKSPLPGFGHPQHRPDDPRTLRLFDVARQHGIAGAHVNAVQTLGRAVDAAFGKHITINATGAIAAVLRDCGVPAEIMRGFALITRCAGLVAHIREEQEKPAMRAIWEAGEHAVPYDGKILA
jgi:citrate synthase